MSDTPNLRRIEHRPLVELSPNPRNPKDHSVETIDASVGRFGFVEPIIIDGRTGHIISGHGRTKALRAMFERGETPPEGVQVNDDGEWLIPVVAGWASRTDTEANAALIAFNRTSEVGGWVDDALLELLDELSQAEDGFEGVGFTQRDRDALDALLHETGGEDDEPLDDDEFDDLIGESGMGSKETLTIKGVSNTLIQRFRSLDGADDAERFAGLMALRGFKEGDEVDED